MKFLVVLSVFGFVLASSKEITKLEDCKCWTSYYPMKADNGTIVCYTYFMIYPPDMECGVPEPPQCQCSDEATSILKDLDGVWCYKKEDSEEKKWACENEQDFLDYYNKPSNIIYTEDN